MDESTQDDSSTIQSESPGLNNEKYAFDPSEVGIPLTKPQLIVSFIGVAICLFLAALDTTIVSTAIPRIASDFHALELGSWIATAYMLSFDALQPLHGKLSDIFGRRNVLLVSVAIFLLGSILCAVSNSMIMLIAMRALQGAGGSGCFCVVMIVIADVVPLRSRGKYQSIANAVFAMASVLGPLLGKNGAFTDHLTWRYCFYINIPFGVVGAILIAIGLKEPKKNASIRAQLKRIDYAGTVVILIMATLILLGLNMGGIQYPWDSAPVLACLIVGFVFVGLFVLVEHKYAKEPIVPLRLFRKRTVVFVCIMQFFFGFAFNAVVIELPLFLQAARADSAMMSGVRLIVSQAAISTVATMMGFAMGRFNTYKPILMCGTALVTTGVGLLALLTDVTSDGMLYGFLIVFGAGAGMVFACGNVAIQSACDSKDLASVTALGMFIQNLGSAIGIAVCSTVINNSLMTCLLSALNPELTSEVTESTTFIRSGVLTPQQEDATIGCYVYSFHIAWYVVAGLTSLSFIASLFIKQYSLYQAVETEKPVMKETVTENSATEPSEHIKNC
ncbi:major facilitator superfamily domain-containing protein [Umbelopsis sp. AD052]|nr:major facilitator superfamily domain-containing protein [Umbelopsis sp. AD052]